MTQAAQTASPVSKETIKQAINDGKAILKEGKSKVDAAMTIYSKIKAADRETIVAALKEGASLTDNGAMTYYYNCKRKSGKPAKTS